MTSVQNGFLLSFIIYEHSRNRFSKTLSDDQVYESIMSNYSNLSKEWISHQWNWMNSVYWAFNDHHKYMIVISLIEKLFNFMTK